MTPNPLQQALEEIKTQCERYQRADYVGGSDDICEIWQIARAALETREEPCRCERNDYIRCDDCGKMCPFDVSLSHGDWARISGRTDGGGMLCLWCIDRRASALGIKTSGGVYFAGEALSTGGVIDKLAAICELAQQLRRFPWNPSMPLGECVTALLEAIEGSAVIDGAGRIFEGRVWNEFPEVRP